MSLASFPPYLLAVASEGINQELEKLYGGESDLSRAEWRILTALRIGQISKNSDILAHTALSKVQVSRGIERLTKKGLTIVSTSSSDKRSRDIELTDKGAQIFDQLYPKVLARTDALLSVLEDHERSTLIAILTKLYLRMPK